MKLVFQNADYGQKQNESIQMINDYNLENHKPISMGRHGSNYAAAKNFHHH